MKFGGMCTCQQQSHCQVTAGLETEIAVQIVHMTAFSVHLEEEVWTDKKPVAWRVFNVSRGTL